MAGHCHNCHQPKLNGKRTLERREQEPIAKRQRRGKRSGESINDEVAAPIADICNELIDRIFDFLDVESLLNVAGTCKRLQVAAVAKFGQKFGKKCVCLAPARNYQSICEYQGNITIHGLKHTLPFLRCFGAEITNLRFQDRPTTSKKETHLYRYIQQYCADTVTTLHFKMGLMEDVMFPVELFSTSKPFRSVANIDITGGHLGRVVLNFPKWFPNLRHLTILRIKSIDGSATAASCPHLEHLSVSFGSSAKQLTSRSITKLLHANPQLKSFEIISGNKKDFGPLTKMLDKNTSLAKLQIEGSLKGVNAVVLNRLTKMHPSLKELILSGVATFVDDAVTFSHELKSLHSLTISLGGPTECAHLVSQLDSQWQHNVSQGKYFTTIVLSQ